MTSQLRTYRLTPDLAEDAQWRAALKLSEQTEVLLRAYDYPERIDLVFVPNEVSIVGRALQSPPGFPPVFSVTRRDEAYQVTSSLPFAPPVKTLGLNTLRYTLLPIPRIEHCVGRSICFAGNVYRSFWVEAADEFAVPVRSVSMSAAIGGLAATITQLREGISMDRGSYSFAVNDTSIVVPNRPKEFANPGPPGGYV